MLKRNKYAVINPVIYGLIILFLPISNGTGQSNLTADIENYIQPLVESNNFSGAIYVTQGNNVLYTGAFGYADVGLEVPNSVSTKFQIASVSKPFTSIAIMLLAQEKKLSPEDPISRYIPDYPGGDQITIHQLLTHSTGIPNINRFDIYDTISCFTQTPSTLVEHFKDLPLEMEPGSSYSYSNSNYNVLALIIEKVSGQSFGEFLRKRFFTPLAMKNTDHPDVAAKIVKNKAAGYSPSGMKDLELAPNINWTVKTGNGSLYSTVRDLTIWARQFFNGEMVNTETRNTILTEHFDNVGYGLFIRPRHNRKQYHINGRSPGFSSVLSYYPDEDLMIVVLSNNYTPLATQIGIDIAAMVFGEPWSPLLASLASVKSGDLKKYCGSYQFGENFYVPHIQLNVVKENGSLETQWGGLLPTPVGNFILRTYWSDVSFKMDENGQVKEMVFDSYSGKKVN